MWVFTLRSGWNGGIICRSNGPPLGWSRSGKDARVLKEKFLRCWDYIAARLWLRGLLSSLCFFCTLVGLDGGLRLIHSGEGSVEACSFLSPIPWIFTLAWALMLTCLVWQLPRPGRRIAMGALGGVACVLFLTHALLFKARNNFFSFSVLIFAGDGFKFLDPSYLRVRKLVWILFLCGIIGTVLACVLAEPGKRSLRGRLIALGAVPLCILAINLNIQKNLTSRLEIHVDSHQASLLYEDFTSPTDCVLLAGMYQHAFRDFCLTYGVYDKFNLAGNSDTVAALDAWYESKVPDPDNEWTGRFAGKNVIMIQLEAIDTWMINEQFMPNLYRLQQESLDLTQHYTPIYLDAGTFNTEMIVNTGLVSPFTGSTASMYSRNAYPDSLANLLTAQGYSANSFHRSDGYVYNRAVIHENWGYEKYHSGADMGISRLDYDTELMLAYDEMTPEEPFLTFIITFSGHGPYENSEISRENYDFAAAQVPTGTPEMVIHAYAHAYETDLFIGQLYRRLEEDGLLDDTVLVVYGDHYNYYTMDNNLIMEQKNVWDKNLITRTPCFIYKKNTPAMKISKVTSSYDLLPTLVNLLGLDNDGRHYVGNDVFSDNGGYAIFADYSWYDGETYWNALGGETPSTEVARRNEELRQRLQMSWDTMKLNYFAK